MCEIDWADFEPYQVMRESPRLARRLHVCTVCLGTIWPGTSYTTFFAVLDGQAQTEKVCTACQTEREAFRAEHHGNTDPSGFQYILQDCIDNADDDPDEAESLERWKATLTMIKRRRHAARPQEISP